MRNAKRDLDKSNLETVKPEIICARSGKLFRVYHLNDKVDFCRSSG